MRVCLAMLLCASLWLSASPAWGQTRPGPRGVVEKAFGAVARHTNGEPAFMVRLGVNHQNHKYVEGDNLVITVESEKRGYLYLYYIQIEGNEEKCYVLYPNDFEGDNEIVAQTPMTIPSRGSYDLKCLPPFGPGRLFALVTTSPLKSVTKSASKSGPALTSSGQVIAAVEEAQQRRPEEFAEVYLDIATFARSEQVPPPKQRRVAVCIGISDFADPEINDLHVSAHDAEVMAQILRDRCQVEVLSLLTDSQATRRGIEQAIFEQLPAKTQPGDTIFIYFSGHGGRCADTNGDEADGFDEYLVPHDGKLADEGSMILDDVFARWMQQLEGRQVCILLDSCHSGGSSKSIKGVALPNVAKAVSRALKVDFLDGELRRAKDLGQKDTEILAACQANQVAWEMPPPSKDSVLTFHLLDAIQRSGDADANRDGAVTIDEIFQFIKPSIQEYVRTNIQTEQTPVLINNTTTSTVLVPR